MTQNPELIYVVGLPYSGTTLIALALGNDAQIFDGGEINFIENDFHKQKICSCKSLLSECTAWAPVIEEIRREEEAGNTVLSLRDETRLHPIDARKMGFRRRLLNLVGAPLETVYGRDALQAYASKHRDLIHRLARLQNVRFVVDASKNTRRLRTLAKYSDLPIHVVYVRRSARDSFAGRIKRSKRRNKYYNALFAPGFGLLVAYQRAEIRNTLSKLNAKSQTVIDYAEFIADPALLAEKLAASVGHRPELGIDEARQMKVDTQHVFTGNVWLSRLKDPSAGITLTQSDADSHLSWFERLSFAMTRFVQFDRVSAQDRAEPT